jgi:hypothetical protein
LVLNCEKHLRKSEAGSFADSAFTMQIRSAMDLFSKHSVYTQNFSNCGGDTMEIQYDTTGSVQNRHSPSPSNPPVVPVPHASSSGGFGAAALVAMVFVVIGMLFATIPTNTFFSNKDSLSRALPAPESLQVGEPATGAVITAPSN